MVNKSPSKYGKRIYGGINNGSGVGGGAGQGLWKANNWKPHQTLKDCHNTSRRQAFDRYRKRG